MICGAGYNLEKVEAVASSAWITDPVHPSGHTFAKMVLNLLEAMAPCGKITKGGGSSGRKRKHGKTDIDDSTSGSARSKERAQNWPDPRSGGLQQYMPIAHPAPVSPAAAFAVV